LFPTSRGFPFDGEWIKLVGPQGAFKPKELTDGTLTLLSTLASTFREPRDWTAWRASAREQERRAVGVPRPRRGPSRRRRRRRSRPFGR